MGQFKIHEIPALMAVEVGGERTKYKS